MTTVRVVQLENTMTFKQVPMLGIFSYLTTIYMKTSEGMLRLRGSSPNSTFGGTWVGAPPDTLVDRYIGRLEVDRDA